MKAHRRPPLAIYTDRDPGQCRWCGEPTGDGLSWHDECARENGELCDVTHLRAMVIVRDGMICGLCGQPGLVLDLEHRVPLWAVAHLAVAERRAFYTTANLQLAHPRCHALKTAGEAAARAEMNRRSTVPLRSPAPAPARPAEPKREPLYRFFGSPKDRRYSELCRIAERGPKGSVVLLFADGHRQAAHRINVRTEGGR